MFCGSSIVIMMKILCTFLFCGCIIELFAQTRLTQNSQHNIWVGNSAACTTSGPGTIHNNSFLRVFDTDDHNVLDTIFFVYIELGVESTSGGNYDLIGRVHELNGVLQFSNMSLIAADTAAVYPDSTIYKMIIPMQDGYALPGDTLVCEVFAPLNAAITFFPGSNPYVESGPSYIAASGCGMAEPTTYASIGYTQVKLVLNLWVNHKPFMNDLALSVFKDEVLSFTKSDFDNSMSDFDSDTTGMIRVESLPLSGTLALNSVALNIGDTVYSDELSQLTYTPNTGFYGADNFSIRAHDAYHWANNTTAVNITVINWQLGITDLSTLNIELFPNPVDEFVYVKNYNPSWKILLYNSSGAMIEQSVNSEGRIATGYLASGIYYLVIDMQGSVAVSTFIKK